MHGVTILNQKAVQMRFSTKMSCALAADLVVMSAHWEGIFSRRAYTILIETNVRSAESVWKSASPKH